MLTCLGDGRLGVCACDVIVVCVSLVFSALTLLELFVWGRTRAFLTGMSSGAVFDAGLRRSLLFILESVSAMFLCISSRSRNLRVRRLLFGAAHKQDVPLWSFIRRRCRFTYIIMARYV